MGEGTVSSRYVKLTKDQDAPAEDIRPGELNQPVQVPQVRFFLLHFSSVPMLFLFFLDLLLFRENFFGMRVRVWFLMTRMSIRYGVYLFQGFCNRMLSHGFKL